jgi:hypothetical protein
VLLRLRKGGKSRQGLALVATDVCAWDRVERDAGGFLHDLLGQGGGCEGGAVVWIGCPLERSVAVSDPGGAASAWIPCDPLIDLVGELGVDPGV